MTAEVQGKIQKFLYHLSNEQYHNADNILKDVIKTKLDQKFQEAYNTLEQKNNKNKK